MRYDGIDREKKRAKWRADYYKRKARNPAAVRENSRKSVAIWRERHPEKWRQLNRLNSARYRLAKKNERKYESVALWRERNPEKWREINRANSARWRKENPEKWKKLRDANSRRYREQNPTKYREARAVYRAANRAAINARARERYRQEKAAQGDHA